MPKANTATKSATPAKTTSPTISKDVEVRHSPIHGRGVFALRAIPAGRFVGRYDGRRYSPEEIASESWDNTLTYNFALSDGSLIDGAEGGNATRHINHSCAPNCAAYEIEGGSGELWIEIETLTRIPKGQELLLDYCLDAGDYPATDYRCACGAATCRGTMTAPAT